MIHIITSKKTIYSCTAILLCAVLVPANTFAASSFDQAWTDADKLRLESAAVSHEWTTAKSLLAKAKEANEKGETEKAMQLVAKAMKQSKAALAQYEREKEAWKNRVPK